MADEQPVITPNRILGIMGIIIFSLIGVLWTYNNSRIQALEQWRMTRIESGNSWAESRAKVASDITIMKKDVEVLTERVQELKEQVKHLQEDLDEHRKRVK